MLFNSLQFCVFFPVVVVLAWTLRRSSVLRMLMLLAASYIFYMNWNYRYVVLLLFSTLLDYVVGLELGKRHSVTVRRVLLAVSLVGNLGVLFFFKYFNFFADSARSACAALGLPAPELAHSFLLPMGISFYTFQSLSYTIDIYRGQLAPTRSFLKFALFVSFFPQLVAGPIVRASQFLPQLERTPVFDDDDAQRGLYLILVGLFKKICIADVLAATFCDRVAADPGSFGSLDLLLAAYGFKFQIYCDFSGYCDIALGAAAVLGYRLPINFNRPYLATSIGDYWRRWHITLGMWLRDYLYIPLGGSRVAKPRLFANLVVVMVIVGLWHGAAWTFVLWGALHGLYLVIERLLGINRIDPARMRPAQWFIRWVVTFHVIIFTHIIFRCQDLSTALVYIRQGLMLAPAQGPVPVLFLVVLGIAVVSHFAPRSLPSWAADCFRAQPSYRQAAILVGCLVLFTTVSLPEAPFIYFQF